MLPHKYKPFILLGISLWSAALLSAQQDTVEYPPIKISTYSLYSNSPISLEQSDRPLEPIPINKAILSEWIEVTPPLSFITETQERSKTAWIPSDPNISNWILVLSHEINSEETLTVSAIPATESTLPNQTVSIGNLMHKALSGTFNGKEFRIGASAFTTLKLRKSPFTFDAQTLEGPYHCSISIPEQKTEARYLFLLAPPHIKGSAQMTHRLVKIPNSHYETK